MRGGVQGENLEERGKIVRVDEKRKPEGRELVMAGGEKEERRSKEMEREEPQ